MALTPGTTLAHYRLIAQIGEGAMGVVWLATDTVLEREVAIKLLPEAFARDPERLARFEREAKLLASLNHPNIASVHGLHEAEGVRFIVLELVRGESLTAAIAKGLSVRRVLEIGEAIADALAAAHRKHVTHRDLKPDNIMLDAEGRPKVLDFGLAKLDDLPESETLGDSALVTRDGTLLGTIAYMSPEQATGKTADARSDVFSLGVILYEMASGRRPFTGDNAVSVLTAILRDTPPALTTVRPDLPPPLGVIVECCLEKDPDARYKDAGGLRDALRTLLLQLSSGALPKPSTPRATRHRRLRTAALRLLVVAVVAVAGAFWWRQHTRERWLRGEALPQLEKTADRIQGLEEGREAWDAYLLARRISLASPHEPLVARLKPAFSRPITITSDPPGAEVAMRYYDEPDRSPVVLGHTPLTKVDYPRGFTRIELRLPGHDTVQDVIWNFALLGDSWAYRLHRAGSIPADMAWIPGASFPLFLPGLDGLKAESTAAFLMDRHEVTQREYKRFVDAGAYHQPALWKQPFVDNGRTLTFAEAMARFVDHTGKPGPATWEVGTYPAGADDLPVGGISWYEAAAYATWAGKSLPTIFHWNRVAFTVGSSRIAPLANLASGGPVPVGTTKSMNRFGVSDLAGNVREWVWNASNEGQHFILGGGWNDPDYAFVDAFAQPAFDRQPTNGLRCIRATEPEANAAQLERTIQIPFRDFLAEKPVSDAVFSEYLRQFNYDKLALDARIEAVKDTPDGTRQKISFGAAYGGERMLAYLFLPRNAKPPYQVVVVFPGSGSIDIRSSDDLKLGRIDFLTKSGRAVLFPIYKGTYERGGDLHSDYPEATTFYKDYVIMWAKDLARSIDYVESRPDLDAHRVAYYGLSWGAELGNTLPAIETRIRANILYVAGLSFQRALPEVDAINYVRHVHQPTLMLNGELDFFFPAKTSQMPMFQLLGVPPTEKERHVYPGGHSVPRLEQIKESLRWLDRFLGPVQTNGS